MATISTPGKLNYDHFFGDFIVPILDFFSGAIRKKRYPIGVHGMSLLVPGGNVNAMSDPGVRWDGCWTQPGNSSAATVAAQKMSHVKIQHPLFSNM